MSAAAGGVFLDQQVPRWAPLIDLDILDLGDPSRCILAQLCPRDLFTQYAPPGAEWMRYDLMAVHLSGLPSTRRERWSHQHGFLAAGSGYPVTSLTRDWVAQVTIRRKAA